MTTKDQAIAPTKELLALGAFLGAMYDNKLDGGEMRKAMLETLGFNSKPPAPDCRTCKRLYPESGRYGGCDYKCDKPCTNGSQYQPAPTLVLWRTE